MEWTEELIARLKACWLEGLSTAEIGRRLNVSKNAVVGKAHRLGLPARPSPIRRDGAGARPRKPRRVQGPTLPPLAAPTPEAPRSTAPTLCPPQPTPASPRASAQGAAAPSAPAGAASAERRLERRPAPMPVPVQRHAPSAPACCWPIGDPGTPSFHFCGAPAAPGKPYCRPHAEIAYVRVRDRREDAA